MSRLSCKLRTPPSAALMKFECPEFTKERSKEWRVVCVLFFLVLVSPAFAGSATWKAVPTDGDWSTATNWTPETVPNGAADTALFGFTQVSAISVANDIEVDGLVFQPPANAFTFTVSAQLTISGAGIENASPVTQSFEATPTGQIVFSHNASAGGDTLFTANGVIDFLDTTSAGNGEFVANGGTSGSGGRLQFHGTSTAAGATLIANSSANSSGEILFFDNSTGGNARVELNGSGRLQMVLHQSPGMTVGSIEGSGLVFLGADELTVGSNNLSTEFSGVIQDGGNLPNETGGRLTKVGTGTLTLSGANTYTGSTTITSGSLVVNGSITSAVTVNGGTFGGSGAVGAVTVNSGGVLSPGASPGILHVAGNLTLAIGSTYLVQLNGLTLGLQYDQTNVIGTVSLNSATLSLSVAFIPVVGTSFTIIDNDSTDAISGAFNGLPEGASLNANGQVLTITYTGGDGNDVVVTVVPEPGTWVLFLFASLIGAAKFGVQARARRKS